MTSDIPPEYDVVDTAIDEKYIQRKKKLNEFMKKIDEEPSAECILRLPHPWRDSMIDKDFPCELCFGTCKYDRKGLPILCIHKRLYQPKDIAAIENGRSFDLGELWKRAADLTCLLPKEYSMMVDPKTIMTCPINGAESSKILVPVESQKLTKPYHPSLDHDYALRTKDVEEESSGNNVMSSNDEPYVEVWEIENFYEKHSWMRVAEKLNTHHQKKETRRSSVRAADLRRKKQAAEITHAVRDVLLKTSKNPKPRSIRQYKNIKPKNSVETTPSQSDIEEFHCKPARHRVRQTVTRVTKKKTCKGRINHSESERLRRQILRMNFASLCDQIPRMYLIGDGEKETYICKKKILVGAKGFIIALRSAKGSYKTLNRKNGLLRDQWKKTQAKLLRCVKRRK